LRWNGPLDPETISRLPAGPGSYALCLWLAQEQRIAVGRLGVCNFPPGGYVYLGSAHGPGGLRARLAHHARLAARPRWHLDYFRPYAGITGGFLVEGSPAGGPPLEWAWSQQLLGLPGAQPTAAAAVRRI
jgi:hypothetical protein